MTALGPEAARQAARDATSKLATQHRPPLAALAWLASLKWRTKFVFTAVAMLLLYAIISTFLSATGLRAPPSGAAVSGAPVLVPAPEDDPARSIEERARIIVAREIEEKKKRKAEEDKRVIERANEAAKEAEAKKLRDAVQRQRELVETIDPARERLHRMLLAQIGKSARSFTDTSDMDEVVAQYYAALERRPGFSKDQYCDDCREELRHVRIMPYESAAALILKYLGKVDRETIKRALWDLHPERSLGKPEQMRAFEAKAHRLPLFPELPKLLPKANYTAIDNKPITPQQLAELHELDAKWQLQDAILGVYKDCEEHYRPLYLQHLNALFQQYLSSYTEPAASVPQDKTYPLYLLGDHATPNERISGALVILWQRQITSGARALILGTPEAVLGARCPADRRAVRLVGSSTLPSLDDIVIIPVQRLDSFTRADLPLTVQALTTAYDRCRPSTRDYFVTWMRDVAAKVASLKPRDPILNDTALSQLRSTDRATLYRAVRDAFIAPALDARVAAALPDAASRLFHDRCPKTPAGGELDAHRADVAERKARHDEIMEKYRTK